MRFYMSNVYSSVGVIVVDAMVVYVTAILLFMRIVLFMLFVCIT